MSFGFVIGENPERPNSEWLYTFEPLSTSATLVTESYRMIREPLAVRWYYRFIDRNRQLEQGVATTLDRLQRAAEGQPTSGDFPNGVASSSSSSNRGYAISAVSAWEEVSHGRARILDLRSRVERARWGYPPTARKVSFLVHALRPDLDAIYLCQHAVRSKVPRRKGAREVDRGFMAWLEAGLPVDRPLVSAIWQKRRAQRC